MQWGGQERRAADTVSSQLAPGEQVVAILGRCQTGPSPWFSLITYLFIFFIKFYAVVATNQRLFLVRLSFWTGRPKAVDVAYPLQSVQLIQYNAPTLWGVMKLATPVGELKLNVPRISRAGADAVAATFHSTGAPPPPPPPPTA